MITLNDHVVNPRYIVAYKWSGQAQLEVFLSHSVFPNGATRIVVTGDSPSDITSLVELIEEEINAGSADPR